MFDTRGLQSATMFAIRAQILQSCMPYLHDGTGLRT
jgi:hypothetical protein